MSSVCLDSVTKTFDSTTAVDALSLNIADGEFFVILGPSGAGKTTTLRLIAGLEAPDGGAIHLDGENVTQAHPAERDVAFVFQQYSLYPHLTVFDNIAFPLRSPKRRVAEAEIKQRVEQVAAVLQIENKLARKATALSGGEMQRVAIGRALVRQPKVFLMDEPLSSLDAKLREELRIELKRLQRDLGATVIYVTHDQVEATTLADRIGIIEDGRLLQVDSPERIYEQPHSLKVAQRLGSPHINLLPAAWMNGHAPRDAHHLAIRPEDIQVVAPGGPGFDTAFPFSVLECSLEKHLLVAERDGIEARVTVLMEHAHASGSEIRLAFPKDRRIYFDCSGKRLDT